MNGWPQVNGTEAPSYNHQDPTKEERPCREINPDSADEAALACRLGVVRLKVPAGNVPTRGHWDSWQPEAARRRW